MIKLKDAIKVNNYAMKLKTDESLADRIMGNYNAFDVKVNPASLLYLAISELEIFLMNGGINVGGSHVSINNKFYTELSLISRLVEFISRMESQKVTYKDKVYVEQVLSKFGITDTREFISKLQELVRDEKHYEELIKLYKRDGKSLKTIIEITKENSREKADISQMYMSVLQRIGYAENSQTLYDIRNVVRQFKNSADKSYQGAAMHKNVSDRLELMQLKNTIYNEVSGEALFLQNPYEYPENSDNDTDAQAMIKRLLKAVIYNMTSSLLSINKYSFYKTNDFVSQSDINTFFVGSGTTIFEKFKNSYKNGRYYKDEIEKINDIYRESTNRELSVLHEFENIREDSVDLLRDVIREITAEDTVSEINTESSYEMNRADMEFISSTASEDNTEIVKDSSREKITEIVTNNTVESNTETITNSSIEKNIDTITNSNIEKNIETVTDSSNEINTEIRTDIDTVKDTEKNTEIITNRSTENNTEIVTNSSIANNSEIRSDIRSDINNETETNTEIVSDTSIEKDIENISNSSYEAAIEKVTNIINESANEPAEMADIKAGRDISETNETDIENNIEKNIENVSEMVFRENIENSVETTSERNIENLSNRSNETNTENLNNRSNETNTENYSSQNIENTVENYSSQNTETNIESYSNVNRETETESISNITRENSVESSEIKDITVETTVTKDRLKNELRSKLSELNKVEKEQLLYIVEQISGRGESFVKDINYVKNEEVEDIIDSLIRLQYRAENSEITFTSYNNNNGLGNAERSEEIDAAEIVNRETISTDTVERYEENEIKTFKDYIENIEKKNREMVSTIEKIRENEKKEEKFSIGINRERTLESLAETVLDINEKNETSENSTVHNFDIEKTINKNTTEENILSLADEETQKLFRTIMNIEQSRENSNQIVLNREEFESKVASEVEETLKVSEIAKVTETSRSTEISEANAEMVFAENTVETKEISENSIIENTTNENTTNEKTIKEKNIREKHISSEADVLNSLYSLLGISKQVIDERRLRENNESFEKNLTELVHERRNISENIRNIKGETTIENDQTITEQTITNSITTDQTTIKENIYENIDELITHVVTDRVIKDVNLEELTNYIVSGQKEEMELTAVNVMARVREDDIYRDNERTISNVTESMIHKQLNSIDEEEILEKMRVENRKRLQEIGSVADVSTTNVVRNRDEMVIENTVNNASKTTIRTKEEIQKMINERIRTEIEPLSEKIYKKLEYRLRDERRRRGF
ncbi:MAG: hypothetical protein K6G84_07160 [Lachnospiraceae bacterium]|nr:hypothetical protein [Lachnospiraceae bacterium]